MAEQVRNDFPIDWERDGYVSRREFFKYMVLASGGLAAGSSVLALLTGFSRSERRFEPAMIAGAHEAKPGSSMSFAYPRPTDLCILVRKRNGEFVAFSRRCTHLSCPVLYQAENDRLFCPCHNGAFSIDDGGVLQGPPPHALPQIMLEHRGAEIWAVGVQMPKGMA